MAGVLHIELGLKIWVYVLRDWLWSVIAPALGLKTIPDLLDTNSTHTGIAYAYLAALHSCDYMGYLRHVRHAARSSKNHVITWARIRQVLTLREVEKLPTSLPDSHWLTGLITIYRRRIHPWAA